jgi:hypothetical protein
MRLRIHCEPLETPARLFCPVWAEAPFTLEVSDAEWQQTTLLSSVRFGQESVCPVVLRPEMVVRVLCGGLLLELQVRAVARA